MALYKFGWIDYLEESIGALENKPSITDHNNLSNNGGDNSHAVIDAYMSNSIAHGVTSNIVGLDDIQTLTNKTLDVTDNSLLFSNIGDGSGMNVIDIIDQQLKTSDNVQFGSVQSSGLIISNTGCQAPNGIFDSINTESFNNSVTINGVNPLTTDTNLNSHISANSNVHGVIGNVVGTTDAQTLTNKTIYTNSNTVIVNGLNLNSVINQEVHTFSDPTFNSLSLTFGLSEFGGNVTTHHGTVITTDASNIVLLLIPGINNSVILVEGTLWAYCTAGSNINATAGQKLLVKVVNVAGSFTITPVTNNFQNNFATNFVLGFSGSNVVVQITGIVSNTIKWYYYIKVYSYN